MTALLLAAALAAAQPAQAVPSPPALPERLPYDVVFARFTVGPWEVEGRTYVDDSTGLPLNGNSWCEIRRPGLQLTTWHDGGLTFRIDGGIADPDLEFDSEQVRGLVLDGAAWEYREVDYGEMPHRFLDFAYPPPPPPPDPCGGRRGHDIILYGCPQTLRSHHVVVRRSGGPWLAPATLANELLGARTLRIGHRADDGEDGERAPLLWTEIPLAGLAETIAACRTAIASDAARRFHTGLER